METKRFEFCDFVLDPREGVLFREGQPVPITPKTFDLLHVLIENRGRIVGKDELMKAVWRDSFVAEGNLAFTIGLLRKVLNDDKQNPKFIETVSKRGYRFVANVNETLAEGPPINGNGRLIVPAAGTESPGRRSTRILAAIAATVFAVTAVAGYWLFGGEPAAAPVLATPFTSEKLSTNGRVFSAAISPDGGTVVYTYRNAGKQSVWLRQLDSGTNLEIIPPSDDSYYDFAFSPDGGSLYFGRRSKGPGGQNDIYRVSVHGGIPVRIATETQGWLSLSPDGASISFVRCYYTDDENCSLWIADAADGKNERKLVSTRKPFRIADNRISPDGKRIGFAVGQSENAANEFGLSEIDIQSGVERELSAEKFFNIKHLTWLPERGGLLVTAAKIPNKHFRIWHVSAVSGEAVPVTNDSETYSVLSLDKNAANLISTHVKEDFRLRLFQMNDPASSRVVAQGTRGAFAPDGKILYSSSMTGNSEIWIVNADGSGQRQLTTDIADDIAPLAAHDRNFIFFSSNRSGEAHVWRMNADGSNQTQITKNDGGFPIFASPDGAWLYYHHGLHRTLWRISLTTGEEEPVWEKGKYFFAFSPDGSQIAFAEHRGSERMLAIISAADRKLVRTVRYPDQKTRMLELKWLPDGTSLIFILSNNDYEQNEVWLQPLNGENARKIAGLGNEEVSNFAVASDGKSFIVGQGEWKHDAVLIKGLK